MAPARFQYEVGDGMRKLGRIRVRQHRPKFIDIGPRMRREPLPDRFNVPNGGQKLVGLIEDRVLHGFRRFIRVRHGVEMVGNHIDGDARLVMLGIEEILKVLGPVNRILPTPIR